MKRTISSFRPLGAVSASMSVTKPYLYLSSARTCSTVSRLAAIQLLSCMHECFCRILPAATALLPLLLAGGFIHARANLLADLAGQADARQDRQSVEEGKRVSVRVDLGGRRLITKKKKQ